MLEAHIPEKQLRFKTQIAYLWNFSFFLKSQAYKVQKPKKNLQVSKIDS